MNMMTAPPDGARHTTLVQVDTTAAEQFVRSCTDLGPDQRENVVGLLRTHARHLERQTERFLRFSLDVVRELQ